MEKLIDTHAHLQFEKFNIDREEVIKRNSEQLFAVVNPGADLSSSENSLKLAQKVDNFYSAIGVHPHHTENWNETYLPKLKELIKDKKVVAIGEIGLDNHLYQGYPQPDLEKQTKILLPQIELALKENKPILFHCRKAYDELYNLLKEFPSLKGLIHCFMGSTETAKKFLDLGLYISFAGNLTYKNNEEIREAAKFVPNDRILIETDSPYLAPELLRGSRNEPVNVLFVAETLSVVKKLPLEEIAYFTNKNSRELFKI
jgi:TatD DNase family protein